LGDKKAFFASVCYQKNDNESMHDPGREQSMPCVLQGSTNAPTNEISALPTPETAPMLLEPPDQNSTEVAWVDADVEYVGLDDEGPFKTLLSDSSDSECDGDVECVGLEDDLVVEDAWGCETIIHATNLENPKIAVGITFGDGHTFKKAIRQYAIKENMKLQLHTLSRQGIEAIARLNGANGGYMLQSCRVKKLGWY
jgi:hypothetical protein